MKKKMKNARMILAFNHITRNYLVFMPPKELREAYENRTVRPSVRPSITNHVSAIAHKLLKQI